MGLSTLQNAFTVKKKTDRQTERQTNKQTNRNEDEIDKQTGNKKKNWIYFFQILNLSEAGSDLNLSDKTMFEEVFK